MSHLWYLKWDTASAAWGRLWEMSRLPSVLPPYTFEISVNLISCPCMCSHWGTCPNTDFLKAFQIGEELTREFPGGMMSPLVWSAILEKWHGQSTTSGYPREVLSTKGCGTLRGAQLGSPDLSPAEVLEHSCILSEGGAETCWDHAK